MQGKISTQFMQAVQRATPLQFMFTAQGAHPLQFMWV